MLQHLLPFTPISPSLSPPPLYNISQPDYISIIRNLEKQVAALSALVVRKGVRRGAVNTEVAKLQIFNRTSTKVSRFVTAYRLYIRMKMRKVMVEE